MIECERYAKPVKSFALLLLAIVAGVYTYFYADSVRREYPSRSFSVEGKGETEIAPDVAKFSVSVVTEGDANVVRVQAMNTEKMNTVNAFLKKQGVDSRDLRTSQYSLSPKYSTAPCPDGICPEQKIIGYTLTQALDVKVRDMGKLGDILSGVVQNGANSVSDVRFVVDDDASVKSEAREAAIKDARKKAEVLAKAGGFRLGKLLTLYESSDPVMPYAEGVGGAAAEKSALSLPAIEPGTNTKTVTVSLTYEILD